MNLLGECWIARRGPGELVGVGGEAGVIEDQFRLGGGAGGEGWLLPVAADDQQGRRLFWKGTGHRLEEALGGVPGVGRSPCPVNEEAGTSAVGKENGGLTIGVAGHGLVSWRSRSDC